MKLSGEIIVEPFKITEYLLVWKAENDKSGFLKSGVTPLKIGRSWPMKSKRLFGKLKPFIHDQHPAAVNCTR